MQKQTLQLTKNIFKISQTPQITQINKNHIYQNNFYKNIINKRFHQFSLNQQQSQSQKQNLNNSNHHSSKLNNNNSNNIRQNNNNNQDEETPLQKFDKTHTFDDPECSNCQAKNFKKNKFICGSCKTLLPPERKLYKIDFFELFGLQQNYNIDKKFLEQQYKDLMQNFHPDRYFALNNNIVLKDCEEYSSYVNSAYQSLKSDYQRAYYYLEIKGHLKDNQEAIIQDMDFLDDLLFLREEIQVCKDINQLTEIKEDIQKQYNQIVDKLQLNFDKNQFEEANDNLNILKYHESTLELILKQEERL